MSAAADEASTAAGRVGVVASIGYLAFLGGPPIIGFLGNRFTVLHALTVVVVVLVVSTLLASTLQPRQTSVDAVPLSSSTTGS